MSICQQVLHRARNSIQQPCQTYLVCSVQRTVFAQCFIVHLAMLHLRHFDTLPTLGRAFVPCQTIAGMALKVHACVAGSTGFQKLQTLLLRDNQLSTWGDVDSLNRLPGLTDLRLSGNPILTEARGGGRYEVHSDPKMCCVLFLSAEHQWRGANSASDMLHTRAQQ